MGIKAKPIFICRLPLYDVYDRGTAKLIFDELQESLPDYRLIGLFDATVSRIEFECFNSNISEKDLSAIKSELAKSMEIVFDEIEKERKRRENAVGDLDMETFASGILIKDQEISIFKEEEDAKDI